MTKLERTMVMRTSEGKVVVVYDLLIKGGTVIDGLRVPRYKADVGVTNGRVSYIGRIAGSDARQVIDADGLIVAPGFIDLHTHYDSQIYWDPWCTISGYHGVTSVAIGNCGFGFAPCKPEHRERAMMALSRNEAIPLATMQEGMPWDWETFPEFLTSLERTSKGVNVMPYVGLSPLYAYVMGGFDAAKERRPNEAELDLMCQILVDAINAGACGFSAQLMGEVDNPQRDYDGTPMVTDLLPLDEFATFARAMGSTGTGIFQIAGSGRAMTLEAAEVVARESGRPVLFNVLSALPESTDQHGAPVRGMEEMMAILNRLNDEGMRVYGQANTNPDNEAYFTLEDYNLFDTSELWREATMGSPAERLAKLRDPQLRAALRAEHDAGSGGNMPRMIAGMTVHSVPENAPERHRGVEGLTMAEIAKRENKHPIDAFLDLACGTNLRAEFQTAYISNDIERMRTLVNYKYSLPGISDGGAHTKYFTLGNYTTQFITDWVREHHLMELEEAHWRLSTYPAEVAGIRDRGFLREGAPADIIVYDFEQLGSLPVVRAYDFPAGEWRLMKKATGYRYTIVNGEITLTNGEPTNAFPGEVLQHGVGRATAGLANSK